MRVFNVTLALLASSAPTVTVWSSAWGEVHVSREEVRVTGGLALNPSMTRLDASRFARVETSGQGETYTLVVTNAAGQVQARRRLNAPALSSPQLWGTARGPCVAETRPQRQLNCFSPDLKNIWATLPGEVTLVTRDGTTAFLAAEPSRELSLNLVRVDLASGRRTVWPISTFSSGSTKEGRDLFFQAYEGEFEASVVRELPGNRVLAFVTFTLSRWAPRYDVLDARTGARLATLDSGSFNTAFMGLPEVSKGGTYLAAHGNTVHVWEAASGRRLLSLRDPAWSKAFAPGAWVGPLDVLFMPDERRMVVRVWSLDYGDGRPLAAHAFVYALPSGRPVTSFARPAR